MPEDEPQTADDVEVTDSTVVDHRTGDGEEVLHVVIHTEDHGAFAGDDLEQLGVRAVYDSDDRQQAVWQAEGLRGDFTHPKAV